MPSRDQIEKARSWLLGIIADGEHAGVMRMAESLLAATEPVPPEDPRDKRIAQLEDEREKVRSEVQKLRSLLGEDTCLNELQRICGLMEPAP